jgi:predicted GIY-YIG superfamily endonuclease
MSVPESKEFLKPILSILSEGNYRSEELRVKLIKYFKLNESDLNEKTPQGKSILDSRVYQGLRKLGTGGLGLIGREKNVFEILPEGEDYLKKFQEPKLEKPKPKEPKTEEGFVYYIQEEMDGNIKIGWSNDPIKRLPQHQTSNSRELRMLVYVKGSQDYETEIHKKFQNFKTTGEWFKPDKRLLVHIEKEKSKFFEIVQNLSTDYEELKKRLEVIEERIK